MDYKRLYETNAAFKAYVDKYATKHRITPEEAITHKIVQAYGAQANEYTNCRENKNNIPHKCDT